MRRRRPRSGPLPYREIWPVGQSELPNREHPALAQSTDPQPSSFAAGKVGACPADTRMPLSRYRASAAMLIARPNPPGFPDPKGRAALAAGRNPRAQHLGGIGADLSGGIGRRTDPLAPLNRIGQVGKRTRESSRCNARFSPMDAAAWSNSGKAPGFGAGTRSFTGTASSLSSAGNLVGAALRRASFPCDRLRTRLLIGPGFRGSRWWCCSRVLRRPSLWGKGSPRFTLNSRRCSS